MRRWGLVVLMVGVFTIFGVACQSEADGESVADQNTPAPTETPQPSPTVIRATFPPTWTPLPDGFTPEPTATREATATPESAGQEQSDSGLPPTWTPAPGIDPNIRGGVTWPTPSLTPAPIFVEDICYVLAPNERRNAAYKNINLGSEAVIAWKPLPNPEFIYNVQLIHPDRTIIINEHVSGAEFVFPADVLTAAGFTYNWLVRPIINNANACYSITGEIYVEPVFE